MIRLWIRRATAHFDQPLLVLLLFALAISLAVMYSASGQDMTRMGSQLGNMLVACAVLWLFANLPPQHLQRVAVPLYLLGLLLLLGVALFGDVSKGARRWLDLGVMRIQPSELMRIAVPMMLAWYFSWRAATLRLTDYLVAVALLAAPVVLIARQPDLGTALMIGASGFYVLFLAGLSWRLLAGLGVVIAASAPVFWHSLHEYQQRRIEFFLNPHQDPLGNGYHTIQSTIALGSGGLAGKGWLNGTQSQLDFLPERHTDFIFAVFGEEFGLLGNLFLLGLFGAIVARSLTIASHGQNTFCRLLAGSIALTFFTYAFVNMGMVSGILPVVGVPLPLISYGGTSLVTLMIGFGILMSIQTNKRLVAN